MQRQQPPQTPTQMGHRPPPPPRPYIEDGLMVPNTLPPRQPGLVVPQPTPAFHSLDPWEKEEHRARAGLLPRWRKVELGVVVGVTQVLTWTLMPTPAWPLACIFCGLSFWGAKALMDEQVQALDKGKRMRGELPPLPSPGDLVDWPRPAPPSAIGCGPSGEVRPPPPPAPPPKKYPPPRVIYVERVDGERIQVWPEEEADPDYHDLAHQSVPPFR